MRLLRGEHRSLNNEPPQGSPEKSSTPRTRTQTHPLGDRQRNTPRHPSTQPEIYINQETADVGPIARASRAKRQTGRGGRNHSWEGRSWLVVAAKHPAAKKDLAVQLVILCYVIHTLPARIVRGGEGHLGPPRATQKGLSKRQRRARSGRQGPQQRGRNPHRIRGVHKRCAQRRSRVSERLVLWRAIAGEQDDMR